MKILIEFDFPGVDLDTPEYERAVEDLEADLNTWAAQFQEPYRWSFMDGGARDDPKPVKPKRKR